MEYWPVLRERLLKAYLFRRSRAECVDWDVIRVGIEYGSWLLPSDYDFEGRKVLSAGLGVDSTFEEQLLGQTDTLIVLSIDPTPASLRHWIEVVQGHPEWARRWHFRKEAIWSSPGHLRLGRNLVSEDSSLTVLFDAAQESSEFLATTYGALLKVAQLDRFDIVKLDIEGAEVEVLGAILASHETSLPDVVLAEFDRVSLTPIRRPWRLACAARETKKTLRQLHRAGYKVVAVDGWNVTFRRQR